MRIADALGRAAEDLVPIVPVGRTLFISIHVFVWLKIACNNCLDLIEDNYNTAFTVTCYTENITLETDLVFEE